MVCPLTVCRVEETGSVKPVGNVTSSTPLARLVVGEMKKETVLS